MSTTITLVRTVAGTRTSADTVLLAFEDDAAIGIKNNASGLSALAATSAITATSVGLYEYSPVLSAGSYTVSWKVTVGVDVEYFERVFVVDDSLVIPDGVTLAEIERDLGDRVGPFYQEGVTSGTTSTAILAAFKTSMDSYQDVVDLYVLRRGLMTDGSAVVGFHDTDRVRICSTLDAATGTVTVDRLWTTAPVAGEELEFHYLHPTNQLRRAVLLGLKRCWVTDMVQVTYTEPGIERDLTDDFPWLTLRRQVRNLEISYSQNLIPAGQLWFKTYEAGAHVWAKIARDPYPNTLRLFVLRPAWSEVNGETSADGPNDDSDVLTLLDHKGGLDLASLAGHVTAYKRYRARLLPVAREGMHPMPNEVARDFTRECAKYVERIPARFELPQPFDLYLDRSFMETTSS